MSVGHSRASDQYLRRYTDLPSLVYLLRRKAITLLNTRNWDDANDRFFVEQFRSFAEHKAVLALCFVQGAESYHHWKVFADGSSGVCVTFKRERLLKEVLRNSRHVIDGEVTYRKLTDGKKHINPQALPFTKRIAFKDEREFRLILPMARLTNQEDVSISLACIDKVTLSPWIDRKRFREMRNTIQGIKGCRSLRVSRSLLLESSAWQLLARLPRNS